MKKALFIMLAIVVTLVAACQPDENQNKNKNANGNANGNGNANRNSMLLSMGPTDKIVQIFVHDVKGNPGYYTIEDPGSVTLHTQSKQRAVWCVFYDGSMPPDEVIISGFHTLSGPIATNPFGAGNPTDNEFHVPAADFNDCKMSPKSPAAGVTYAIYKYLITTKAGGTDRGHLDPQVVIND